MTDASLFAIVVLSYGQFKALAIIYSFTCNHVGLGAGVLATASSNPPSLVLNDVKGPACPGGDLEYTCTASFTTTLFSLRWIESNNLASQIIYLYNFPVTLTNNSIAGFNTTVSIIPPDYTLTSTATLSRALLSDDNITLQCQLFTQSPVSAEIVVTKGITIVPYEVFIPFYKCSPRCN